MPTLDGSPLVKRETTKFDDWPLALGFHLTGAEARKVRAFIRMYHRYFIFSLDDIEGYKRNPSTFSWRTTNPFLTDLIGSIFPSGLVFRLVAESSW